jgi:cyanophycin synthetase
VLLVIDNGNNHKVRFMKILEISAMRGPNFWSVDKHKLIVLKLDIGRYEDRPTDTIKGFADRLERMFPGMYEHYCSIGKPGGFFQRVQDGTWMGHVVEHIALELQTLAGMDCGFGRTRGTGEAGIYNIIFSYVEEECGRYAAKAAVRIAKALAEGERYDVDADIEELRAIHAEVNLGPSTMAIVEEARKRGIPSTSFGPGSRLILGQGANQKKIQATIAGSTSSIGVEIAGNKDETKRLLKKYGIPAPDGIAVKDTNALEDAIAELGFPLVIKPLDGNHGKGATINIKNIKQAREAFSIAKKISNKVIVERYITGFDFRFLVVNYKLVAVAKRTPASVTGDGVSTIRQLIERENCNPSRGEGHDKVLTKIKVDNSTDELLASQGLSLSSVAKRDEVVYLKATANLSTGGTSTDVTDSVHPYNIFIAERIARLVGLDICGIDVIAPEVNSPIDKNGGAVLEVNAAPGLRMHLAPAEGTPRNVAEPILDMLFPEGTSAVIPVIAVTGTNGKTTTTRLLAHMAKTAGFKTGFVTTDGIYVHDRQVKSGDCTGPSSAETILTDPSVEFAVLECARGGILRSGLGFSKCDIGIVTNVSSDHLGMKDINTLDDMARVKSVIAESVSKDGYAILNADDDLVYAMSERVRSKFALFSLHSDNTRIKAHCKDGGIAAVIEKGSVVIIDGKKKTSFGEVKNIPLTFNGTASFMVQNVLGAVAAGYLSGFTPEVIKSALKTFVPSPKLTPGRMNVFQFRDFSVLLDYAHNAAGLEALGSYLDRSGAKVKVGIIAGVGDRRDEDIIEVGEQAARMFDEVIIRMDDEMRGRTHEEMAALLKEGLSNVKKKIPVKVIPDTAEAIRYAVENAVKGSIITVCCEKVNETIRIITGIQQSYEMPTPAVGPERRPEKKVIVETKSRRRTYSNI